MMINAGEEGEREREEYSLAQCRRFLPRHNFPPLFIANAIIIIAVIEFISSLFFNLDKCDYRNSVVFTLQVEGRRQASF